MVEAVKKVGNNGLYLISVVEKVINELEFDNRMHLDWRYVLTYGPYFINDEWNKKCILENPFILIHENKILNKKIVEQAIRATNNRRPLLIVAESAEVEFVESLGTEVCVVVPTRSRAEKNKAIMEDLAIFTGGQVVTAVSDINSISSMLGSCEEVIISSLSMTIIGGSGSQKNIDKRREQLESRSVVADSCSELEFLKERLANLSLRAATFKVGGATSEEMVKNSIRACNVVRAVEYAIKDGFVAGKVSFLEFCLVPFVGIMNCSFFIFMYYLEVGGLHSYMPQRSWTKCKLQIPLKSLAFSFFKHVLKLPLYSIATRAGFDGTVVIERLLEEADPDLGYDPAKGEYVDMLKAGNMDPYKLISEELHNLISGFFSVFRRWGSHRDSPPH